MGFFGKIFASENTKKINKLKKIADKIELLSDEFAALSDQELADKTKEFKARLADGEKEMDILPEAFATVREAATRVLGMRHFYVQLLGGIALFQGRIAEMKTGEGKTLVETLPAYLGALSGKGVHIVTVNEYLAKRDSEWMGKVFVFLGLSVGISLSGMTPQEKREAYLCDITYLTNNELGFDYLRDNMCISPKNLVMRQPNFAIVDEVDSILIDEARTPLIISGRGMKSSEAYQKANRFARSLCEDDYEIDIKLKTINLSESGVEKAERFFGVETLTDLDNMELNHHINNALKANYIMIEGQNYIVKDGEVVIVDEFTGRLMQGRRYSEGLHQAIEAKENVKIKDENKTLATITFQNLFRLYPKLSGMTGTAKTEEMEFNSTYNLDVVCIPPNKPVARIDYPDAIFLTVAGKNRAIANHIAELHKTRRPILIGTITIEKSEELSRVLTKKGIKHVVLNAKNHEQESEIVAQAGRLDAVTIATNMAGRGTDILLGGNAEGLAKNKIKREGVSDATLSLALSKNRIANEELDEIAKKYNSYYAEFKKQTDAEREEVTKIGGLAIVGTERHESRRIDNQLRGRSGRQGDPGSSVFFISLEDDLAKRFGGERMKSIATAFRIDEDTPFQIKMLSKQIERAQKSIEMQNYSSRKSVLNFDDVLAVQRKIIYGERSKVLAGEDVHEQIMEMFPQIVQDTLLGVVDENLPPQKWDVDQINTALEQNLFAKGSNPISSSDLEGKDVQSLAQLVLAKIDEVFAQNAEKAQEIGLDFADFERFVLLKVIDTLWMDHIDSMTVLRNEVGLQAYGNHDPIVVYKKEGFDMFERMIEKIKQDTTKILLSVDITKVRMVRTEHKNITTNNPDAQGKQAQSKKVVGRNDPCPCGSGKKYKNCCGK